MLQPPLSLTWIVANGLLNGLPISVPLYLTLRLNMAARGTF